MFAEILKNWDQEKLQFLHGTNRHNKIESYIDRLSDELKNQTIGLIRFSGTGMEKEAVEEYLESIELGVEQLMDFLDSIDETVPESNASGSNIDNEKLKTEFHEYYDAITNLAREMMEEKRILDQKSITMTNLRFARFIAISNVMGLIIALIAIYISVWG